MELIKDVWTQNDYEQYRSLLKDNADDVYRKFHQGLCKTSQAEILGVRLPVIRQFAKSIARGNVESFLVQCRYDYYEEIMTQGLVVAYYKKPLMEKTALIDNFVGHIDNWAVCDSFCSTLKPKAKELDELFSYLQKYISSDREYEIRFATVLMMDNFITEKYVERLFETFEITDCSFYYTSMAVAWSISFCFASFRDKTLEYLKKCSLDDDTFNRAVQKCCDSFRISREDKELLKTMKRKTQK